MPTSLWIPWKLRNLQEMNFTEALEPETTLNLETETAPPLSLSKMRLYRIKSDVSLDGEEWM